jgi:hypothetical protein
MRHNVLFRPSSVLAGLAVAGALFILGGMRPLGNPPGGTVYFNQSAAYVVADNTELIIGALGVAFDTVEDFPSAIPLFIQVRFDDLPVLVVAAADNTFGPGLQEVPVGLVAGPGTEVTVRAITLMGDHSRIAGVAMGTVQSLGP